LDKKEQELREKLRLLLAPDCFKLSWSEIAQAGVNAFAIVNVRDKRTDATIGIGKIFVFSE
jgi:hypothetical protein